MYPNFRYFFYETFGLDVPFLQHIQMYGFWLAMAFVAGAFALTKEMKRRESLGLLTGIEETVVTGKPASITELLTHFLLGFVVGFKVIYYFMHSDKVVDAGSFVASLQGDWLIGLLLGVVFAAWRWWEKNKAKLPTPKTEVVFVMPHERVGDIVIMAALAGIAGSKALFIMDDLKSFSRDPFGQIFSPSGLTFYGGLIGGFLVVSFVLKKKKINYIQMLECMAPVLILAYGVGRLGCQFAGDGDWGIIAGPKPAFLAWAPDWVWAQHYTNNISFMPIDTLSTPNLAVLRPDCNGLLPILPNGDIMQGRCTQLIEPVFPTPMYEFFLCMGIFAFLWWLRKRLVVPGQLFATYLILNGIERFSIESIRVNEKLLGSLTQAQIIAMTLSLIGVGWWIYLLFIRKKD